MKKLLGSIMAACVLIGMGVSQAATQRPLSRDLDSQLFQRARVLNRALENNVDYMNQAEKRQSLRLLNDLIQLIRGEDDRSEKQIIKFTLDSDGFAIEAGGSVKNILEACMDKVSGLGNLNVDDITVSVNGTKASAHNNGWWTTPGQKCQVIAALGADVIFKQGASPSRYRYVLHGIGDSVGIIGEGNSLDELERSCQDLTKVEENIDDIAVSLSGGARISDHNNSWWVNTEQVCGKAISLVF